MYDYLSIKGFREVVKIQGVAYVIKKADYGFRYKYDILKIKNDTPIEFGSTYTIEEARTRLEALRKEKAMDERDARIRSKREALKRKGLSTSDYGVSIRDIYEAYEESKY